MSWPFKKWSVENSCSPLAGPLLRHNTNQRRRCCSVALRREACVCDICCKQLVYEELAAPGIKDEQLREEIEHILPFNN